MREEERIESKEEKGCVSVVRERGEEREGREGRNKRVRVYY